jgi:hypothetical protein
MMVLGRKIPHLPSQAACSFVTLTATSRLSSALLFATYTNKIMNVARVRREIMALIKNLSIFCGKYTCVQKKTELFKYTWIANQHRGRATAIERT